MANLDTVVSKPHTKPMSERIMSIALEIVVVTLRACLGTILGLCTSLLFGAYGLVLFTGLPFGTAISIIALGLNGVLLTSIALGSMVDNTPEDDEDDGFEDQGRW